MIAVNLDRLRQDFRDLRQALDQVGRELHSWFPDNHVVARLEQRARYLARRIDRALKEARPS